jgi:DNA-binding winged helix-turn-helix (wHTH) protein
MTHYQTTETDYLRDEIERLREKLKDAYECKKTLKKKGYYVENLWCIDDVIENYHCTEEEAQIVLHMALTNPATIEQIFMSIDYAADNLALRTKER